MGILPLTKLMCNKGQDFKFPLLSEEGKVKTREYTECSLSFMAPLKQAK